MFRPSERLSGEAADEAGAARDELAALASAAAGQDPRAVRTFISAVGVPVRGAVRMVLGPQHRDVDDVTQEATMGLLQALSRFRGECTVAQFARRVAVLTALAARRRHLTAARWTVVDDSVAERVASGAERSPWAEMQAARRRELVRRLLDELPDILAETIALYFMLGHTAEEIAAMTNVPMNTVWSRIRLGRNRLKRKLDADVALQDELLGTGDSER